MTLFSEVLRTPLVQIDLTATKAVPDSPMVFMIQCFHNSVV